MHCLELVYCKNYFKSYKYLFWGNSKWKQIRQSALGLNRGHLAKFSWLRSVKHMKLIEECLICMEKSTLVRKKKFTNRLNVSLPIWAWIEKTVHAVETHWLSGKVQWSLKKVMLTIFWAHQEMISLKKVQL